MPNFLKDLGPKAQWTIIGLAVLALGLGAWLIL